MAARSFAAKLSSRRLTNRIIGDSVIYRRRDVQVDGFGDRPAPFAAVVDPASQAAEVRFLA